MLLNYQVILSESLNSDRIDYFIETLNDLDPGYWSGAWSDYVINVMMFK